MIHAQDVNTNAWTGSVLAVSLGSQAPSVTVQHAGHQFVPQPVHLDVFQHYTFWRWQLDLQLLPQESVVEYSITAEWTSGQPSQKCHAFTLPGQDQSWHWGFHSCNGFSHGVEQSWLQAATTLWQDVLQVHAQMPLHCMVGGGDQLYQDGFFQEPALVAWLSIKERAARESAPVTPDADAQISHFMFHHYCNWFSKDHMATAFACIPQSCLIEAASARLGVVWTGFLRRLNSAVRRAGILRKVCIPGSKVMTWDDHDLMDGYGSYPESLQNCPVFQHAFHVARRFYLLFQQHTTLPQAQQQANLFGSGETFSLIRLLGRNVALVAPDVRSERTRKQVLSPASWQLVFDRIAALPTSVRHLVMVTTIPVVYPKIPLTEKAMSLLSNIGREHAVDMLLSKTGLWGAVRGKVVSGFNEPELLDDLLDHWTSDFHSKERETLIRRLQDVAKARNMRVTFISGDVHVGGLGRLYSHPKLDLRKDFRFMPQVISSAIMNAPPPAGVVSTLHTCSNAHMSGVDKHTKEKMVRLFKADYPKTDKLIAKRNWATLRQLPAGMAPPLIPAAPKDVPLQPGDLLVTLRVEADHKAPHQPVKQYPIPIPTLQPLAGAYGAPGVAYGGVPPSYASAQPAPAYGSAPAGGYAPTAAPGSFPSAGAYDRHGFPQAPAYGAPSGPSSAASFNPQQFGGAPPQASSAVTQGSTYGQQQGAAYYAGGQQSGYPAYQQAPGPGPYESGAPPPTGNLDQQLNQMNIGGSPAPHAQGNLYPPPPSGGQPGRHHAYY